MNKNSNNDLFKAEKRKEQLRQELERAPQRIRWAARKGLERVVQLLSLYIFACAIPLAAWFLSADWPGEMANRLVGWSFLPAWMVFGFLVPCVSIGCLVERFPEWYDEENATFTNEDAHAEQKELVASWQAEDKADEERWANRAASAGSMTVVADHIDSGQLSHTANGGELALQKPEKTLASAD